MNDQETDAELIDRYKRVRALVAQARKKMERMKHGPNRERQARNAGSLYFTQLTIETKLEERGIPKPE